MIIWITSAIALLVLLIGSYTDIKTREVPDWINYGAIFAGLGVRLLYSSITFDWMVFVEGLAGFGVCFLLACALFYLGQWGGGDAKMLMALGGLIGLDLSIDSLLLSFLINMMIIGGLFGLLWVFGLAFARWRKFFPEFKKELSQKKSVRIRMALFALALLIVIASFSTKEAALKVPLLFIAMITLVSFYLLTFVKIVEEVCMIKALKINVLTEGDWIQEDVHINNRVLLKKTGKPITQQERGKLDALKKLNPFVDLQRISFFVWRRKLRLPLAQLQPGDRLGESVQVRGLKLNKGVLDEDAFWKIQNHLHAHTLEPALCKIKNRHGKIISTNPFELTTDDTLLEPVFIQQYLCGPKDLGISRQQIDLLTQLQQKKKIQTVLVKEGMPFVPSFCLAFIVSLWVGNLLLLFI